MCSLAQLQSEAMQQIRGEFWVGHDVQGTRHLFGNQSKPLFCVTETRKRRRLGGHTFKLFILLINGPCGLTLSLSSSLFSCLKFSLSWNSETCFKPLLCLEQDLLFVRAPKEGHLALGGGWNCCCLSFQGEPLDKRIQLFQLLPIPGWRVT